MRHQIVKDGIVINTIVWDGETKFTPPEGCEVIADEQAGIGWTYAKGKFTAPPQPEPEPIEPQPPSRLNLLEQELADLKKELVEKSVIDAEVKG